MINIKKFLFIFTVSVLLLFSLVGFGLSQGETEIIYPRLPTSTGVTPPTTTKTLLPDYIKYLFTFSISIAGLIAFGSLVYGGVLYVMSTGDPSSLNAAKERISSAGLGLVILLSSYLILTTINPQLVVLTAGLEVKWGIVLYKNPGCSGESKAITMDTPDLGDFNNAVKSVEFKTAKGTLDLQFYAETGYKPDTDFAQLTSDDAKEVGEKFEKLCLDYDKPQGVKSIKFVWKLPGVYLIDETGKEKFISTDTARLDEFNDKTKKIKFNNNGEVKFAAVLHQHQDWKGECKVFATEGSFATSVSHLNWVTFVPENTATSVETADFGTSSVTVFTPLSTNPIGKGVTLCENDNYGGTCWGSYQNERVNVTEKNIPEESVTSIRVDGNYIAVLFGESNTKGVCEVFTKSDSNLRDNPIGRCHCGLFGWGCKDCLKSFIVIPTR